MDPLKKYDLDPPLRVGVCITKLVLSDHDLRVGVCSTKLVIMT